MKQPDLYSSHDVRDILLLQLGRRNNGTLKTYEQKAYDLLTKSLDAKKAEIRFNAHGYVRTAFIGLLHLAGGSEIHCSQEFEFLKQDECLYHGMFLLQGGSQCRSISLAIRSHYLEEIKANNRIDLPQLQTAISAIEKAYIK